MQSILMQILELLLTCYTAVIILVLIFFLGRIAYFYQKTSQRRVGYLFVIFPALLLVGGVIWYVVTQWQQVDFVGSPVGDILLFLGGLLLFLYGARLQQFMTGE